MFVVQKDALLGEMLAHSAYPGVLLGLLVGKLFCTSSFAVYLCALLGGGGTALLAQFCHVQLSQLLCLNQDVSLGMILSGFFGLGIFFASVVQNFSPSLLQEAQLYFWGQIAVLRGEFIIFYFVVSVCILILLAACFRPLKIVLFDPSFAQSIGISVKFLQTLVNVLLLVTLLVGLRSLGVLLISAMLIAPALAARPWVAGLAPLFYLSGFIGGLCGGVGAYFSMYPPLSLPCSLPTGPIIVVLANLCVFFGCLFAWEGGLLFKKLRIFLFQTRSIEENVLKALPASREEIQSKLGVRGGLWLIVSWKLLWKGLCVYKDRQLTLTSKGQDRLREIVRLHRLWEVYLVWMGQSKEKVHVDAEEIEHVLTPALEKELSVFLHNPVVDPHEKPIPPPRR